MSFNLNQEEAAMSSLKIKEYIDRIYSNVFFISTRGMIDLEKAIRQAEEEINELYDNRGNEPVLERSKCLIYLELLSRYIRSSLIEMLYLRETDRENILKELIDTVCRNASEVKNLENDIGGAIAKFSVSFNDQRLVFKKTKSVDSTIYKLILDRSIDQYHSEFFPQEVCIEECTDGCLGEFIEKVLEKHQGHETNNDVFETQSIRKANVVSIIQDNSPEEELVVFIDGDTRTVDILDQFEGYGDYKESPAFKRIVISNPKYGALIGNNWVGFNLVIERSNSFNHVGDITFTDFKQKKDDKLREHVKKEMTPEILEAYLDKDEFYRFKEPFLLRAQNSSNRVGYGWQWDWSGGYGDYIEGTEYGETTNYIFAGAYVTSGYAYIPDNRVSFNKKNEPNDNVYYQIVPYTGVVKGKIKNDIQEWYVLTGIDGSIKSYTKIYVDLKLHKIYVQDEDYKTYNALFNEDKLVLHPKNGFGDKEIQLLPGTKVESSTSKPTVYENKNNRELLENHEATTNKLGINQKGSITADELVECIYQDTSITDLFDEFEGYGQIEPVIYQRIVIKNSMYRGLVFHKSTPGFNFVIERGKKLEFAGVMTFAELRQGKDKAFAKFLSSEITSDIIADYLDTVRFYRFSKPILLKTQYCVTRSSGRANEYYIVGTYISSGFVYDAKTRSTFKPKENSTICNKDSKPINNTSNSFNQAGVMYSIRPYTGTVRSKTNNKTVTEYILVKTVESSKGYIPVIVDDIDKTIYVYKLYYEKYLETFNLDTLQLCSINGTKTRKLAVSTILHEEELEDTYITEKPLNHNDTLDRLNDLAVGIVKQNEKAESNAIVKKKKATIIRALKSGDRCPNCGKLNSNPGLIKVIDKKGNSRSIVGLQCSCGTVYLTKKQYKKIQDKAHLEIYEINAPKSVKPVKKVMIPKYNPNTFVDYDKKMISKSKECKKCGKTPIAAGAMAKGLQLCWECYKEEISSMFDY